MVAEAVVPRLLGREPAVALGIVLDVLEGVTAVLSDQLGETTLREGELLGLDGDVGSLATETSERLVHHDASVRKRVALAGMARCEEELAHRCRETHAYGGDVATDELHGVVDGHAGRDRATGAVDVQPDVGVGVLALEVEQLGTDLVGDVVVDVGAQHDHPVLQEAGEDVGTGVGTGLQGERHFGHGNEAIAATLGPVLDDFTPNADELLANNREYARDYHDQDLALRPARHLAIVACMDSRMDIFQMLGLAHGDAHVIRNAGGVVTDDVIRSLVLSQRLLGTREIILIHHTDCGLQKVSEDELKAQLESEFGIKPRWSLEAFKDPYQDVRQSMSRLQRVPYLTDKAHIRGFVYEVLDGLLHEVAPDPRHSGGSSAGIDD